MGKRKRRVDKNKTPLPPRSDFMPYSSRMDSLSKKSSRSVDNSGLRELVDSSLKLPNSHHSPSHFHQNLSQTMLLRHPQHYYGRQYSRRNSTNHSDVPTSHRKSTLRDEKLSFKLATQFNIDSGRHADNKEKVPRKPERIRPHSLEMDSVLPSAMKMVCGICQKLCQKLLKRKPFILENTMSSSDISVVAVLVCGHVYHADCLETRTSHKDRRDPPCPLCQGQLS